MAYTAQYTVQDFDDQLIDLFGNMLAVLISNVEIIVLLVIVGLIATLFREAIGKLFGVIFNFGKGGR